MTSQAAPSPVAVAGRAQVDRHFATRLKAQAYGLGFDLAGIARLGPAETTAAFDDWLARGYAGDMSYLARGAYMRRDTRRPAPGMVSALVVALDYGGRAPSGPVARYARGDDYHEVMRDTLGELHAWVARELGGPIAGKGYVDTGPLLERDLARRAGLGWFGKNTNLVNPGRGSFFFLGALLLALDLEPDPPFEFDRCGSCTRCLDACPTNAFAAPRVLDARRCISYLTIELRGAIPEELREPVAGLLYGCDICQDVCPYNQKFARELRPRGFEPRAGLSGRDARTLARAFLAMSHAEFSTAFKGSPMKRAKFRGLKRNAATVLGNVGGPGDVPVLVTALEDPEPLVRGHAAWALGRIASPAARAPLRARAAVERDPWVADELRAALAALAR